MTSFNSLVCLSNSSEVFALNELRSDLGFNVCCKDAIADINKIYSTIRS